jgi:hypothetical protein
MVPRILRRQRHGKLAFEADLAEESASERALGCGSGES